MKSTEAGKRAEEFVAKQLEEKGHEIVELNWRTRWCEIDLVSKHANTVYFTEVKYRSSGDWGSGFDYITTKKLSQMRFAAEFWISDKNWKGDAVLQAAEVDRESNVSIVEI